LGISEDGTEESETQSTVERSLSHAQESPRIAEKSDDELIELEVDKNTDNGPETDEYTDGRAKDVDMATEDGANEGDERTENGDETDEYTDDGAKDAGMDKTNEGDEKTEGAGTDGCTEDGGKVIDKATEDGAKDTVHWATDDGTKEIEDGPETGGNAEDGIELIFDGAIDNGAKDANKTTEDGPKTGGHTGDEVDGAIDN